MATGQWETDINEVLLEFEVIKENFQEDAAKQLNSVLHDYFTVARHYGALVKKHCYEAKPIHKSGVWVCPACGKKIPYHHSYCHWCGKKVGWNIR